MTGRGGDSAGNHTASEEGWWRKGIEQGDSFGLFLETGSRHVAQPNYASSNVPPASAYRVLGRPVCTTTPCKDVAPSRAGQPGEVAGPEITPKALKWQSRASDSQSPSSEASSLTAPAPQIGPPTLPLRSSHWCLSLSSRIGYF